MVVWSDKNSLKQGGYAPPAQKSMPLLFPRVNYEPQADPTSHAFRLQGIADDMDNYLTSPDPEYDWASQAEELASQTDRLRQQIASQRQKNASINLLNQPIRLNNITVSGGGVQGGGGGPRFQRFVNAIAGQESGGNYGVVNQDSGAAGKYQIMPGNFVGEGGWDKDALGRDITLQKFLSSPKLQERIARNKLKDYYSKYGARGAASAWYSGDPNKWRNTASQGSYPSIARYVQQIIRRMNGG